MQVAGGLLQLQQQFQACSALGQVHNKCGGWTLQWHPKGVAIIAMMMTDGVCSNKTAGGLFVGVVDDYRVHYCGG